jgi:phospholipase/carboxylesterase
MGELAIDPSAVLWSAPERERASRPLLVLLHGLGSHEGDLFGLSPQLPLEPVVASVRAPLREGPGFAWFPRSSVAGHPVDDDVDAAASAVLGWLDTLDYESVALLGFSQGAAMALQLLRHAPRRFTSVVALSGFIAPGAHAGDAELAALKPPVFAGRGTLDQVIPTEAVARVEEWLPAHSRSTIRIYEDLGHALSTQELKDFNAFLREHA